MTPIDTERRTRIIRFARKSATTALGLAAIIVFVLPITGTNILFKTPIDWEALRLLAVASIVGGVVSSFVQMEHREKRDPLRDYQERMDRRYDDPS